MVIPRKLVWHPNGARRRADGEAGKRRRDTAETESVWSGSREPEETMARRARSRAGSRPRTERGTRNDQPVAASQRQMIRAPVITPGLVNN